MDGKRKDSLPSTFLAATQVKFFWDASVGLSFGSRPITLGKRSGKPTTGSYEVYYIVFDPHVINTLLLGPDSDSHWTATIEDFEKAIARGKVSHAKTSDVELRGKTLDNLTSSLDNNSIEFLPYTTQELQNIREWINKANQ